MGMYNDLVTELGDAFDNDLADATKIVSFVKTSNVYDPDTMTNIPTEVTTNIRALVNYNTEKGIIDDITSREYVGYLVLDTDRDGYVFEVDQIIRFGTQDTKVVTIKPDPVSATWKLSSRKIG